jgi:AcrR family transcriptional regulator
MHPTFATRTEGARSKRSAVVAAAIDRFARHGFEHTKWVTIAEDVGIGEGTLYYYFESKAECLLAIMRMELAELLERFEHETGPVDDPTEAMRAAVRSAFQGAARDVLQRRILLSHFDLLSTPRRVKNEECERRRARALVCAIEQEWSGLIRRGVQRGEFHDQDVDMSTRLALALVGAGWGWYHPDGPHTLDEIVTFTSDAVLRLVA